MVEVTPYDLDHTCSPPHTLLRLVYLGDYMLLYICDVIIFCVYHRLFYAPCSIPDICGAPVPTLEDNDCIHVLYRSRSRLHLSISPVWPLVLMTGPVNTSSTALPPVTLRFVICSVRFMCICSLIAALKFQISMFLVIS